MKKAFVHLKSWQPCEILRGPYEFKGAYRVRLAHGKEMIVPGELVAESKPISAKRQAVAKRRAVEAVKRAHFCASVLKIIGNEIRLDELMRCKADGEWLGGIYGRIRFWPEFAHLKREWRGRKLWIVNPDAK